MTIVNVTSGFCWYRCAMPMIGKPPVTRQSQLWIGAVLRTVRHRRGLTQGFLAERSGLSDTTWSRFEQGSIPLPEHLVGEVESWLDVPQGFLRQIGSRIAEHFRGETGTAAWRFRKAGEMIRMDANKR